MTSLRRIHFVSLIALLIGGRLHSQEGSPLPDLQALFKRSDAVMHASSDKTRAYRYVQLQSLEGWNSSRDKAEETVDLVYVVGETTVTRRILKDRSPLDEKEQADLDKSIARGLAKAAKSKGKPSQAAEEMNTADLMRLGTFTPLKRRTSNGRSILVTNFIGDPKSHTSGPMQKLAAHLSAMLVFDEEDGALQAIDAKLESDVSFALVIKAKKGLHATMRYVRLEPGVWVPLTVVLDGTGKMFFNTMSGHMEVRYYAYRKVSPMTQDPFAGKRFAQMEPEVRADLASSFVKFDGELAAPDDTEQ